MKQLSRSNTGLVDPRPLRILQFGGGNFLRAFFDWMVDILNEETDFDGDVVLVKPTRGGNYQELIGQDCLFHTVLHDSSGEVSRLIGCIQKVIQPYSEWQEFLATASLPWCRFVVSNTTESGIAYEFSEFNINEPPNSFPAKLTMWLFQRFEVFNGNPSKGVIILPTELIEDNGGKLLSHVLQHAKDWNFGDAFSGWILSNNHFCNTLVDRIVSGFPRGNEQKMLQTLGFEDHQMVVGESYHQWVIESDFNILDELPFHNTDLNVKLVDDLAPYRESKVRILNGAHTAMVPVGMMAGLTTVYDVMDDKQLAPFVRDLVETEIVPTFTNTSIDPKAFAKATIQRFINPSINHQLKSISVNASTKFQVRLLPTIVLYFGLFKSYPRRILFSWAALIFSEMGDNFGASYFDGWDLMGLNKDQIAHKLQVDLKNINQYGIRRALELT